MRDRCSNTESQLKRALFRVLDARLPASSPVIMAVPLAFPIVEAAYLIHERIPQDIGLIRRYVLDGVCQFGPCSSSELNELLGLGADIIQEALAGLMDYVPGLLQQNDRYRATRESNQVLSSGKFVKVVEHQRTFIVNALTDVLLPINFWPDHRDWRLYPDPGFPDGAFLDDSGGPAGEFVKIHGRMGYGQEDLQDYMNSMNSIERAALGIPAGGFGIVAEPESVGAAWVASFLLVEADETMSIVSPGREPVLLLDTHLARRDYLRQICEGWKSWDTDLDRFAAACDSLSRRGGDQVQLSPGESLGDAFIRLPVSGRSTDGLLTPLTQGLVHGRFWDHCTRFIFHLLPADPKTAERLAVLRALWNLRQEVRSLEQDQGACDAFDIELWWTGWQQKFIAELPDAAMIAPLSLESLLREANQVPDTQFLETLDRVVGNQS